MLLHKVIRSLIIGILIAIPTTYLSLGASLAGVHSTSFSQALGSLFQQSHIGQIYVQTFIVILLGTTISAFFAQSSTSSASASVSEPEAQEGPREYGTVKWFNSSKGFGFITRDQGDDIFVHYRSIRGEGHRSLREGQKVDFIVTEGEKGLQAEDVIPAAK